MSAIRVTKADIRRWLITVVRMDPSGFRANAYVKAYNVVEKIRREKTGHGLTNGPYRPTA
jgi:hypothetical protein